MILDLLEVGYCVMMNTLKLNVYINKKVYRIQISNFHGIISLYVIEKI